jgi:hypothetical protein
VQYPGAGETSPQTQWVIDQEVQRLVAAASKEVTALLSDHRGQLDQLAAALLRSETLGATEAYAAAGVPAGDGTGGRDSDDPAPAATNGVHPVASAR